MTASEGFGRERAKGLGNLIQKNMLRTAVTFFILALIAIVLGASGVAGVAMQIGWVLLAIGVILFIVNALTKKG